MFVYFKISILHILRNKWQAFNNRCKTNRWKFYPYYNRKRDSVPKEDKRPTLKYKSITCTLYTIKLYYKHFISAF